MHRPCFGNSLPFLLFGPYCVLGGALVFMMEPDQTGVITLGFLALTVVYLTLLVILWLRERRLQRELAEAHKDLDAALKSFDEP